MTATQPPPLGQSDAVPVRLVLVLLALSACRGPVTRQVDDPPPPPPPSCGDGLLQEGEDCDASDLGASTCQSLGFDTGRLVCTDACGYDTALCVKRCGNGQLDLGEACDGTLGVEPCATWGFNACSDTCTVDTRRCVATQPFEPGPVLDLAKGGPAVLGDVAPKGPGDLVMAVPSFGRVELFPWSMTQGFEAATSRKLSFQRTPVRVELLDVNGDQANDVATVNADGTFDLLVFGGSSYALQALDGGCVDAGFLPSNGLPRADVVAVGCGGYATLDATGARFTATPNALAFARAPGGVVWVDASPALHELDGGVVTVPFSSRELASADFDGDGDQDLVTLWTPVSTPDLGLYENTGAGYAPRHTDTAAGLGFVRAVDLDQDGRVDLAWVEDGQVSVRRGLGDFSFAAPLRLPAAGSPRSSFAVGDVDGDGDLDLALTVGTGPDSTTTRLFLNRLR